MVKPADEKTPLKCFILPMLRFFLLFPPDLYAQFSKGNLYLNTLALLRDLYKLPSVLHLLTYSWS